MPAVLKAPAATQLACAHCGDDGPTEPLYLEKNPFCCAGCRTVYELRTANNLCTYYILGQRLGLKVKPVELPGGFNYLDSETVQAQLLSFRSDTLARLTLSIPQMHCTSCIWLLEHLPRLNAGIVEAQVQFLRQEITITYHPPHYAKALSGALLVLLAGLTLLLATRSNVQATVLRTPGQLFQKTAHGSITNLYNVSVINKTNRPYPITLRVLEPAGGTVTLVGNNGLQLPAQGLTEAVFFVEIPRPALHATNQKIRLGVFSNNTLIAEAGTKFLGPPTGPTP